MNKVWAITLYRREPDVPVVGGVMRAALTVALCTSRTEAEILLVGNYGDMAEQGWYQYGVIAPLALNTVYCLSEESRDHYWYEFREDQKWHGIGPTTPRELVEDRRLGADRLLSWIHL